jgi:hypothetical protein
MLSSIFPYMLFLVAGGGFSIAYFIVGPAYAYKSLLYVIPIILAAIIILVRRSQIDGRFMPVNISGFSFVHLFSFTILLFIISIIILISFPTRPLIYFAVVSLISGLIFAQILWKRPESTDYLIIFEIILLSLDLIWGGSIKYPLYFGDTDILRHMSYIDAMIQTGNITNFGAGYGYYPLFHIFNGIGIELTDLSLKNGYFIFSGITWQVGILFAYLIFKKLSNSRTFSLIACLLFATSVHIIFLGMYESSRSLAYVLDLCLLYLIIGRFDVKYVFLLLIAISALILAHHTTVLFFIPVIILVYISQKLFNSDKSGKSNIQWLPIQLLVIAFFSYLLYVASSVLAPFGSGWWNRILTADTSININIISGNIQGLGVNSIYFSFAVFFSIVGIVAALKNNKLVNKHQSVVGIALVSIVFLLFFVTGPFDIFPQSRYLLLYRLQELVSPFIIYMIAFGLIYLMYFGQSLGRYISKSSALMTFFVMGIVVIITFFSTIGGQNGNDNNYISSVSNLGSKYFSNSELTSFSFVKNNCDNDSNLYGDYETIRNEYYFKDFPQKQMIAEGDISYIDEGYLIFRSGELHKVGFLHFSRTRFNSDDPGVIYQYTPEQSTPQMNIMSRLSAKYCIYSDGNVQLYMVNQTDNSNL